jgi:hypothetical protein
MSITCYFGGSPEKVAEIQKNGFDPTKTKVTALLGPGVYLAKEPETAQCYGKQVIPVKISVKPHEISYFSPTALATFQLENKEPGELSKSLLAQGIKAVEYVLYDWKRGVSPPRKAFWVLDSSVLTV